MQVVKILTAAALGLVCATSAAAQSYRAVNGLIVRPLSGGDFEVIEANAEGPRGIWCAAASFALDRQGANRAQRLFVRSARGPAISVKGAKSVVFTLDPARLNAPASTSYSVSVRIAGLGLPVHHAQQFCRDYNIEWLDKFGWLRK